MFLAGPSDGNRHTQSSSGTLRCTRSESYTYSYLRGEDIPALVDPCTQTPSTSTRVWGSAARAFIQRTMARLWRQSKRASRHDPTSLSRAGLTKDQGDVPRSDSYIGRDRVASLTRLVLHDTDSVSFSPSSFFRRVEEVHNLGSGSDGPLVPSLPLTSHRGPPRPRRRPPPPVDEASVQAMSSTPFSSPDPTSESSRAQTTPLQSPMKTELDSVLELQALVMELNKVDPLLDNSPALAPRCLHASPSIKSTHSRPPLWSTSPLEALNLSCGPLAELLAVADELKTMKSLDSDDILYMTDAPPPSPLPPNLHAFLDSSGFSLRILEMDVYREDQTFLGVPIPCIVVTSEGGSLPTEALQPPSSLSEDLLAPPPTTYRGRMEIDQPSIIIDGCDLGSPSPSLPLWEGIAARKEMGDSLSPCNDLEGSLADTSLSWEVLSLDSSALTPKPVPLLRRRERSLFRCILGNDETKPQPMEKYKPWCMNRKQKRKSKRISKESIGFPRPLSQSSQDVSFLPPSTVHLRGNADGTLLG
ncbi:hypothetical protein F5148DRAFT_1165641 [Russula earlei]|uniref:Uncharacterized protein n=1 Tax=Russula earlei TaxID=71964 RepID=A0ACC0UKR5_9AGAM|nr:hypothetical protein F5148DRAFT_1165641 [Russula earlei]